ncbi:MAG: MlaD family protein [Wolinella sp.]
MKSEVKVGLFVFGMLVMLFLMSTQINRYSVAQKRGYSIEAFLGNASGLEVYAKVRINGVESGHVSRIYLVNNQAYATLFLGEGIALPIDSSLTLSQESLLSGRYIEIFPGESSQKIAPGESLNNTKRFAALDQTSTSINEAAVEFKSFIRETRQIFSPESREHLTQIFTNLHQLTQHIDEILVENRNELRSAIEGIRRMADSLARAGERVGSTSAKFGESADTINAKLPYIMDRVDSLARSADEMIEENRKPLKNALKSVDHFFIEGNRVIHRLDNYLSLLDKSEIEVAMRTEKMGFDSYAKSYASLQYRPNPTRYYLFEVASGNDYSRADHGRVVIPRRADKAKIYLSAQIGKRYEDILLRAGIIESSGGIGLDYFLLDDQIRASLEAFDFNGRNDLRGNRAHLKASLRWTLLKHVDLYFGADNILNKEARNGFAGIGVRFIDDDFKRLLGGMGGAASIAK